MKFRTHSRASTALALAATTALLLSACGTDPAPADDADAESSGPLHIAYANITDSTDTFKSVTDKIKEYAETLGWTIETYDNNFEAATTLSNAKLMASGDADVVMSWATADGVQGAVADEFANAGKLCLSVNVPIEGCPLLNIENPLYGAGSGENLAAAATAAGWTAADTTFIGINMPVGGENPQSLVAAAAESFSETFEGFEAISAEDVTLEVTTLGEDFIQIDGGGTVEGTNTALRDALQNIPESEHLAIVTVNDDSGLGALAALETAERTGNAVLASTGSSPDALDNLRNNPVWVSEGAVYFTYWAAYLLAMSKAVVDGVELPDLTIAPQNNLTKENVDEYFDGATPIKSPATDPSAEYLLDTGVLQELGIG